MAGCQLILGPWTHAGLLNNSVGHAPSGMRSKFNLKAHVLRFISETLSSPAGMLLGEGESSPAPNQLNAVNGPHLSSMANPEAASIVAKAVAPSSAPLPPLDTRIGEHACRSTRPSL